MYIVSKIDAKTRDEIEVLQTESYRKAYDTYVDLLARQQESLVLWTDCELSGVFFALGNFEIETGAGFAPPLPAQDGSVDTLAIDGDVLERQGG